MTTPLALADSFTPDVAHNVGILIHEWQSAIDTIPIDMATIVRDVCDNFLEKNEDGTSYHVGAACLIAAYTGPMIACGSVKMQLYPLLSILEKRFPPKELGAVFKQMTDQVMQILWADEVKKKLLLAAVYTNPEGDDDDEIEQDERDVLTGLLYQDMPEGLLEELLLGISA